MNLEDLRAVQVDERGSDSLQPLPATFYEQAADYLADLRQRRDRLAERVDDPFDSEEVSQLTDELETAREVVEAIYDRRVGKLVKRASLAAAGMPVDDASLTDEERALFADLVERIEANRDDVLAGFDADSTPRANAGSAGPVADSDAAPDRDPSAATVAADESPESADGAPADQEPEPDGGAARRPASRQADEEPAGGEPDRLTVRITAAVGEIYGVDDRVYTLDSEDVVQLPAANARPLLDRGAAQRVE